MLIAPAMIVNAMLIALTTSLADMTVSSFPAAIATLPIPSPIAVRAGPSSEWNWASQPVNPLDPANLPAWVSSRDTTSAKVRANGSTSGSSLPARARPALNTLNASGANAVDSLPNWVTRFWVPARAPCSAAGSLAIESRVRSSCSFAFASAVALALVGSSTYLACAAAYFCCAVFRLP